LTKSKSQGLEMQEITLQEHAADLVRSWGNAILPNGKPLRDTFAIDGISLWDVIAPIMAVNYVPRALSLAGRTPILSQSLWPYLSWGKATLRGTIARLNSNKIESMNLPEDPFFLFLGFNEYMYRDVLQPIEEELNDKKNIHTVRLRDSLVAGRTIPLEIDRHKCDIDKSSYATIACEEQRLRQRLRKAFKEMLKDGSLSEIIKTEDVSLWPQLRNDFRHLSLVILPRLMWHLAIAKNFLINSRPRLVVSSDVADPRTRIYCLLARQLQIPSLEIQFGLYDPTSVEWQFFVADQLAVWGETSLGVMLDHGIPPKSIKITGSPRHDLMAMSSGTSSMYKLQKSDTTVIPRRPFTVLFASTYSSGTFDSIKPDALKSTKKAVFNLCTQANLNLIVKPHPLEDPRELIKLATKMQRVTIADPAEDIRELIKKCDCFITLGSTATMDAIIARKLVIQPLFKPTASCIDIFSRSGAILVANSIEEFDHYLQKASTNSLEELLNEMEPARQAFLHAWVFKADGESSRRVANLGLEMASVQILYEDSVSA
jgi:hypothetical protein